MIRRQQQQTICIGILMLAVILSIVIMEVGELAMAGGKKKFLKGFILGTLLAKNHYPIVYQMPSHGGGHHGGYGGGW